MDFPARVEIEIAEELNALPMKTAKTPKRVHQQNEHAITEYPSAHIASILVPVDFSTPSTKALKYAVALARQHGAKITPIFVVELSEIVGMFQLLLDDDEIKTSCEAKLMKFARKASVPGTMIDHVLVRKGRPYREIVDAARTLKSDLIVISTNGCSGVTRALLGSVTERVVREAPCPVLVVRENEHEFVQP